MRCRPVETAFPPLRRCDSRTQLRLTNCCRSRPSANRVQVPRNSVLRWVPRYCIGPSSTIVSPWSPPSISISSPSSCPALLPAFGGGIVVVETLAGAAVGGAPTLDDDAATLLDADRVAAGKSAARIRVRPTRPPRNRTRGSWPHRRVRQRAARRTRTVARTPLSARGERRNERSPS